MLFRLKNHLIWTSEALPLTRQSFSKSGVAGTIRSDGRGHPPERFIFSESWQCRRGQPWFTPFCTKSEPLLQQLQNPNLPLSLTHFSLFFSTIHLLLHFSFSISHFIIHLLQDWTSDLDSSRLGALGSTALFKLHSGWFSCLLKIKSSSQAFSYLI